MLWVEALLLDAQVIGDISIEHGPLTFCNITLRLWLCSLRGRVTPEHHSMRPTHGTLNQPLCAVNKEYSADEPAFYSTHKDYSDKSLSTASTMPCLEIK